MVPTSENSKEDEKDNLERFQLFPSSFFVMTLQTIMALMNLRNQKGEICVETSPLALETPIYKAFLLITHYFLFLKTFAFLTLTCIIALEDRDLVKGLFYSANYLDARLWC